MYNALYFLHAGQLVTVLGDPRYHADQVRVRECIIPQGMAGLCIDRTDRIKRLDLPTQKENRHAVLVRIQTR